MPTSPILARADALMQRRRQQHDEADDVPVLTDAVDPAREAADDDFPILLEIEPFEPLSAAEDHTESQTYSPFREIAEEPPAETSGSTAAAVPMAAAPSIDAAIRDILAHELARRVEQRIVAELPRIIAATVRDFLSEQEMAATLQPRD